MSEITRPTRIALKTSLFRNSFRVAVIGGGTAGEEILALAEKMGRLIATSGYLLVCGGLGGVMEAASRGAKSCGGTVLGILPGSVRSEANPWVDIAITTGLGHLRNALVVGNADVVVAIDGRHGTLSEIAHARIQKIPVFGLRTWNLPQVQLLDNPEQVITQIRKYLEA
ncbi:MAG TPA: TIGR00725 family protein [Candidatus Aminicenantes bacterium]|nr:TIGR00725 family protein [Candidatus Aminicenantes bacterium]